MPLTVVPSKRTPLRPLRRPLTGFPQHRLRLVPQPETAAGKSFFRKGSTGEPGSRKAMPDNVTDIASYRPRKQVRCKESRTTTPADHARRRARFSMGLAAAAPPLLWMGHKALHLFHVL